MSPFNSSKILIYLVFLLFGSKAKDLILPCPLEWKSTFLGEFPKDGINIEETEYCKEDPNSRDYSFYISRIIGGNGDRSYTGRVNSSSGLGVFNVEGNVVEETNYEILTNPWGCELSWAIETGDETDKLQFAVPTDGITSNPFLVGKGVVFEGCVTPGNIQGFSDSTPGFINMVDKNNKKEESSEDFFVLSSYSKGLKVNATNFKFPEQEVLIIPEVIGVDEVNNDSPAVVVLEVVHKTRVMDRKVLSMSSFSKDVTSFSIKVKVGVGIPEGVGISKGVGVEVGIGYENEREETNSDAFESINEEELELSTIRIVQVPPFTSIQACSILCTISKMNISFTGELHYSAPGIPLAKVQSLLMAEGISNGRIDVGRGAVVVETGGTLELDTPIESQFLVGSFDPISGEGTCRQLTKLTRELRLLSQEIRKDADFVGLKEFVHSSQKAHQIYQQISSILWGE